MNKEEDLRPNPFKGKCPNIKELAEWLRKEGYSREADFIPLLTPVRHCDELRESLEKWFGWKGLGWAYSPRGRPPSNVLSILLDVLCRCYA